MPAHLSDQQAQEILDRLSAAEREMVLILALNRFGMPSYKITAISERIGTLRGEPGRVERNTPKNRGKHLQKMNLVSNSGGHWQIEPSVAWPILRNAFWHPDGYLDQEDIERYQSSLNREIPYSYWDMGRLGEDLMLRQLQFALLLGEDYLIDDSVLQLDRFRPQGKGAGQWLRVFLGYPLDMRLLNQYQGTVRIRFLLSINAAMISLLGPTDDLIQPIKELTGSKYSLEIRSIAFNILINLAVLQGDDAAIRELLPQVESVDEGRALQLLADVAFWRGDHPYALKQYNAASRRLKARGYFYGLSGIWHNLLLLLERDFKKVHLYEQKETFAPYIMHLIDGVAMFQENQFEAAKLRLSPPPSHIPHGLATYIYALVRYWTDTDFSAEDRRLLEVIYQQMADHGYATLAMDTAGVIASLYDDQATQQAWQQKAQAWADQTGYQPLLPRLPRYEMWERALDGLLALSENTTPDSPGQAGPNHRLVWRVDFQDAYLQPVEQKLTKSGKWSKGRNIALKRLKEEGIEGMTPQDQRIVRHIEAYSSGWYGSTDYVINFDKALPEMVGHPLLFLKENPQLSVELVKVQPQLIVAENADGSYTMSLQPPVEGPGIRLMRETSTRYQLISVSEEQWQVAKYLGDKQLKVPPQGKEQLTQAIGRVSRLVQVQSDVAGLEQTDLKEVEANQITHVLLLPMGDDFKVEVFAKPFDHEPPYLKPGEGRETLIAEVSGERVRTQRNLKQEKKAAKALIKACPTLQRNVGKDWEWYLEDTESCLNLLVELDTLRQQNQVVIEWPKGESLKLAGQADFEQLSLKVKGNQDWFSVEGELKLDENEVMELRQLLQMLQQSPQSKFVELKDGRYLALTERLRKHLAELDAMSQERKGQLGIHPLMADALSEFSEMGAQLKANAAWRKQIKRIEEARAFQPQIPRNLQADLRGYQEEGYAWLSRLAHWGVGACLADDMGLGKTVQALALLLERAPQGPALVVAPASVVRNWLREAEKFTPDLNPIVLSETNRDEAIAELGPHDLLLSSYNLMQIEQEKLDTVEFGTVILDEAQAIKNRQTKRSKAAKGLHAGFRLITTGTPIENHLGELWNLFDFINPGLLGSLEHFNERFAVPIEKHRDTERRHQLRKLLRPFILRRRKSEVLEELPEKTEVTLTVELSEAEKAFYEAIRRDAMDRLSQMDSNNPGEQRMRILAEITRLRQVCCHPDLVSPEMGLSSSKLALFGEVVNELRENGHKALIFSQFVKYLRLAEKWVKEQGISYQYLDGQTPLKKREERVKAFQQGEGDLFLISLKAGGTGLNLTAADYVIHLDPWWNPAVEDQASDRAHRIGQQRPVTVYRLVAENTIEEKIVRLHGEKRELADSLLEGTDTGGKLSSEDLLALIREG